MGKLQIGYYSPVNWRPSVEDGKIVAFHARTFLCPQCAEDLGVSPLTQSGQVANVRWYTKGWEEVDGECLCGTELIGGEEVNLTVDL